MEIIKGELMNVQENHFRNDVEDGNDSSIYTIFHVLLRCKLLCGHALDENIFIFTLLLVSQSTLHE